MMLFRLVTIAFAVIASFALDASAQAGTVQQQKYPPSMADALGIVQPSIVQISFHASGGEAVQNLTGGALFIDSPLGTGFVVNLQGYVITARHVIEAGRSAMANFQAERKKVVVHIPVPNRDATPELRAEMRGSFKSDEFDVVDEDQVHDLALLKLRHAFSELVPLYTSARFGTRSLMSVSAAKLDPSRPREGISIGVSGYPLRSPVLVTNGGYLASSWEIDAELWEASIKGRGVPTLAAADTYYADLRVNPGDSGAPIYSSGNGTVIGICVQQALVPVVYKDGQDTREAKDSEGHTLLYNSGISVVIPIRFAVGLLEKNKIKWERAEIGH